MEGSRAATAIKLFGMTIQVPAAGEWPREAAGKIVGGDGSKKDPREGTPSPASSSSLSSEVLGGQEEERDGEQKKKKKNLQCPRCNSSATKFCYYNNYNVNQPRHFCKNCQRYWTAGGTMRNVPFGSDRRKTKPPSPGNHHLITITDDRRINNETVLCFGSDAPGHAEKMEEQSVSSSKESDVNLNFSYPWISSFPATYLGKHSRNEEEQGMKKSSSAGNGRDQYYKWLSNPKKQRIDRNCKELAMGCIGIEQRV